MKINKENEIPKNKERSKTRQRNESRIRSQIGGKVPKKTKKGKENEITKEMKRAKRKKRRWKKSFKIIINLFSYLKRKWSDNPLHEVTILSSMKGSEMVAFTLVTPLYASTYLKEGGWNGIPFGEETNFTRMKNHCFPLSLSLRESKRESQENSPPLLLTKKPWALLVHFELIWWFY